MATKTLSTVLNGDDVYEWTVSGSGTNEYYVTLVGGTDPSLSAPTTFLENGTAISEGTAGSLSAGEYDYADNDSLGFSTVYVRLTSGGPDPDDLAYGYLVSKVTTTLAARNMEVFDGILLVPDFTITAHEISDSSYANEVLAANGNRRLVQLTNDHATASIFIAWQATQPTSTDNMREMTAGETVWYSALDGIPTSKLWAYQSSGGAIDLKVAEADGA